MRNVVIIGGGFGGLNAARGLGRLPIRVTMIDRRNHHLFQPLLYQVATAGLSPADIAAPIRGVLSGQANTEVLMAEVTGVDRARRQVLLGGGREVPFDDLVIATGSQHSYFGRDEWEEFAPGLKTIGDATLIRERILSAFERAETEQDEAERQALLTFVLVGGGPTGVEMAGSIAELAHRALRSDFRRIDPEHTRILLVEAGRHILAAFPEKLSRRAAGYLRKRGVEILDGSRVELVDREGVTIAGRRIAARTVIWSAGVAASPAAQWLGADADRAGRVKVQPDLTVPGEPGIFVIGDTAALEQDGKLDAALLRTGQCRQEREREYGARVTLESHSPFGSGSSAPATDLTRKDLPSAPVPSSPAGASAESNGALSAAPASLKRSLLAD